MFQAAMSPKILNVEKLQKKFASLTKSRESILGLSTWIIRHKEFYKEIVNEWLGALSKDMNALTMFYVANDVIQNCGRKKAPEFREAFASVLENAVTLEKVKEIKTEVIRMVALWHERAIYDAEFFKKLQDKLNEVEVSENEEELDEAVVIENFKLQKLTDSLQKLKVLENDLLMREEFIEDVEEPGITNIDNLIVKMDSQKELRKVDKFQKLVEDYLSVAEKVMAAQKEVMLNLKYSSIFYSAQLEDAKKVAHAYRIYGKKVKILEKAITEKIANLPEAPSVSEEESPNIDSNLNMEYQFPGLSMALDPNNENNSQSNIFDLSTSPKMNENVSFMNVNILNEKYKSPSTESQNSVPALIKDSSDEKKMSKTQTVVNLSNIVKEEKKISKSPVTVESPMVDEKISPLMDNIKKRSEKVLNSPIIVDATNAQIEIDTSKSLKNEKILKSPLNAEKFRRSSSDKKTKNPATAETIRSNIDKMSKCVTPASLENTIDKDKIASDVGEPLNNDSEEKVLKLSASNSENSTMKNSSVEKEEISSNSKEPPQKYGSDLQTLSDIENIDFLLEKSYNEHRTKSKASFKRKIDNLLKMKQSKSCKLSTDDNLKENKLVSETFVGDNSGIVSCSKLDKAKESDISDSQLIKEESIINSENLEDNEKTALTSSSAEYNNKVDQSLEMMQNVKASDSITSDTIPLPTSVPFPNFPDVPTDLLKNILDKHRTNMNHPSNINPCSVASELLSHKTENVKPSDSNENVVNCSSIANEKNISSESVFTSTTDSKICDIKNIIQIKSVLDNESSTNIKKDDSKSNTESISINHSSTKTTPLMENLQKLLKCFTEKGPAFEELKNSKTLKNLPTYSLRSTLKLYHVLKKHHQNNNALNSSNINDNSLSDIPLEAASTVNNKSSLCNYNSTIAFTHSKNDNLEIMDMEVDSDDDSTK